MAGERYELLERLATGGMAEVFKARATGEHGFQKTLAIKRILPSLAADEEFVRRFIDEAKLAVALTHANIVQVFDFGRFAGSLYIAMEFVDGGDLAALLKALERAERPMPASVALFISIELTKGLDYAHRHAARKVIHRDISPSNLLLSYAGEVKIADFGIAQAIEHARGRPDSRIMGKWRYMSPEQARGDMLDERSDIFSAGAVMFEMFTGRKLVPGADAEAIVKNLQTMDWPVVSDLRPELPKELGAVVTKTLARRPEDRFRQIADLLEELTEISYSRSVRTSSLELAALVRDYLPRTTLDTTARRRADLIDDIIRSEIGAKDASVAARRTEAGDDWPARRVEGGDDAMTTALKPSTVASARAASGKTGFVPGERDEMGLTQWRVDREREVARGTASRRRLLAWTVVAAVPFILAGILALREPAKAPVPTPMGVATAQLMVDSRPPGAEVLVDGKPTGRVTPIRDGLTLPPGPHHIALRLSGYETRETVLELRAGEPVRLPMELERERRVLAIGGDPPGASVKVDGVPRGVGPIEIPDLSPGEHEVVVEMPGHEPHRQTVVTSEGGRSSLLYRLTPSRRFGRVTLSATLSDGSLAAADVYLDGARRPFCQTPCQDVLVEAGRHRLRFVSAALGQTVQRTLDVAAGRASLITDVVFQPRAPGR